MGVGSLKREHVFVGMLRPKPVLRCYAATRTRKPFGAPRTFSSRYLATTCWLWMRIRSEIKDKEPAFLVGWMLICCFAVC